MRIFERGWLQIYILKIETRTILYKLYIQWIIYLYRYSILVPSLILSDCFTEHDMLDPGDPRRIDSHRHLMAIKAEFDRVGERLRETRDWCK